MKRSILVLILLRLLLSPSFAATKYVTQSGSGKADGSGAMNPMSVAAFNAASFSAGDTISFSGTITSKVTIPSGGSSGNRITYNFSGATVGTTTGTRINLNGKSHLNLFGGTFAAAPELFQSCIYDGEVTTVSDIVVSGWTFDAGSGASAVFLAFSGTANPVDITVENNTIDNVMRFVATYAQGDNFIIRNNYARSTEEEGSVDPANFQADLIFLASARTVTISGNKLINRSPSGGNNHSDPIQSFSSGRRSPHGWIVKHNWIEMATGGDSAWLTMEDWTGGVDGLKAFGNVFVGEKGSANIGINVSFQVNPNARIYLYNNTFIRRNNPSSTVRIDNVNIDLYAKNNIVWASSSTSSSIYVGGASPHWVSVNYNFTYNNRDTPSQWTGANGSNSTNPLFENTGSNQFWLSSGSKLIGAGDNSIGSEYEYGIAPGATWPNPTLVARSGAWDVGAYVSTAGGR